MPKAKALSHASYEETVAEALESRRSILEGPDSSPTCATSQHFLDIAKHPQTIQILLQRPRIKQDSRLTLLRESR